MSRRRDEAVTLRCRHVLPMGGPPIEGAWIHIERGRIAAIGHGSPPGESRDLGDAIILPGLVNAHTHLEFSDCAKPLDAYGGLPAWIERVVGIRRSRSHSRAAEAEVIAGGLAESAAAGVTAIGEIATSAPAAAYAARGPRVRIYREGLGLSDAAAMRAAARIESDSAPASAAVLRGISPHAPYSVAAVLGRRLLAIARRHRLPVAMHVAESREEADLLREGGGPFRDLLHALGAWPKERPPRLLQAADWITWLAGAPRGIVVHGTFLPDDAMALARLARHRDRLCVAICPRTTRRLSGRLPPLECFRDLGLRVAIGTDSRASNPDLSVLAECRVLVEAGLASPAEAVTMATRHGAWALSLERCCGILASGRAADLVVLRPEGPSADPFAAALDPATVVLATMRSGRWIHGNLAGPGRVTAGSSRSASR